MFMDRVTTNIAKSQLGFIDFVQKPSWDAAVIMVPGIKPFRDALDTNRAEWERLEEEYEPKSEEEKAVRELSSSSSSDSDEAEDLRMHNQPDQ